MTNELIEKCIDLWKCDKLTEYVSTPKESEPDILNTSDNSDLHDALVRRKPNSSNYIFSDILAPCYIHSLQLTTKQVWDLFGKFICQLIKNNLMTINYLNGQCVKLLRVDRSHVSH